MATQEINAAATPPDTIEVFCSYSHKDEALREELETHLSILQANGVINSWHDHAVPAGTEWADQIDEHLNSAQIILLLISPDFLASKYCRDVEVKRALERHNAREAKVISIILRDVDWHGSPLSTLQALPKDARAVVNWPNRDQAFKDVAVGIRKVAAGLRRPNIEKPRPIAGASTKTEPPSVPLPIRRERRVKRYAAIGVIAAILLAGLGYLTERKRLVSKNWTQVRYDDRDLSNCMRVEPCLAKKEYADSLRTTDWTKVNFDFYLLSDCMGYPACVERQTQAAQLNAKTDWTKVNFDFYLLSDCMGYPACVRRATQAAKLKAKTDWTTINPGDQPLLKDCMGLPACIQWAKRAGGDRKANAEDLDGTTIYPALKVFKKP